MRELKTGEDVLLGRLGIAGRSWNAVWSGGVVEAGDWRLAAAGGGTMVLSGSSTTTDWDLWDALYRAARIIVA